MTTLRAIRVETASFNVEGLRQILDGDHANLRREVRSLLETFDRPTGLTQDEYRELVLEWLHVLADRGIGSLGLPRPYGDDDPATPWPPFPAPIGLPMEVD